MGKQFHHKAFRLTVADAERTRRKLDGVILKTPVLASKATPGVSFKPENLQVTGSFKIRPAYSQILALTADQLDSAYLFRYFDHARAKAHLGWEPQIPFEQTIQDTIAWMKADGQLER